MFNRFVEINSGRRHLMIVSEDVGKFPQHYVKGQGWFTCLDHWTACPFCLADGGGRYQRKTKYYFGVVELDGLSGYLAPKVLLLSKARGEQLVNGLNQRLVKNPFFIEKIGSFVRVELSGVAFDQIKVDELVTYDWGVVCKPISQGRAQEIVGADQYQYSVAK